MPPKFRTRFPVARIKRIMQVDEEIGKVAQATPILISKAIELFLQHLINAILEDSKAQNITKVAPSLIKKIITEKDQFDFLRHLVENIPDEASASPSKGSPKKHPVSDS